MPKKGTTALRAVMFTDVVGSTELAREMGDVRWSRLLAAQRRLIRAELKAAGGHEIDTAGDGFFAVFDGPADAVRCAFLACQRVQDLGLDVRAGVHFGEVETSGGAHGIVVHTGARAMGVAGAAEVVITQTVKDLVAGSRFDLRERGVYELKGVPGSWTLFDVLAVDEVLRPEPIEGASVASERRARASAAPPPKRSLRLLIPVAAAAALILIVGTSVATRPGPTYVPTAGSVARIGADGRSDRPVAVGAYPTGLGAGEGHIWVVDQRGQIYWIDPSGDTDSRGTAGTPTGVAIGSGAIWITNGFGTTSGANGGVSRLDPATDQLAPAFETPLGSEAIAWGADQLWVADANTASVTRYDTVERTSDRFAIAPADTGPVEPGSIVYSDFEGGTVWVGDASGGRLFRLDAADPHRVATASVGGPVSALAPGTDAIWATSAVSDTVYVVDPHTVSLRTSIDVGKEGCNAPTAVAIGSGGVWVACSLSQELIRIDPGSTTVTATVPVNGAPDALVTDERGDIWVAIRPR
jgi:class 3 adenylate cyclase/sugar lactone lactonase YvrE